MINNGLLEILLLAQHKADVKLGLHSKRVACYALELAKALNQSAEFKKRIFMSGLVHDIGFLKLDVDFAQISRDMTLQTDVALIQRHVIEGEKLLSKVIADAEILEIVRHHHEKFNGEGYPDKLKGEEISLASRILAVVDLYDAMIVGEMFGEERSVPQDIIHYFSYTASGAELDPELVKTFLALLQRNPVFYLPVENNDMNLYKIVYLSPGKLEEGDLCDQYGTVLVKQGAELTQHTLDNIRSNYPGQKIIYVPEPEKT
ncbi:MAG: HD domain-containing phosphohydrolase [Methylococcaceae bacterium]